MNKILIGAVLLAAAGAVSAGAAYADGLYRWVDKQGVVHYGDYPKQEGAEQLRLHVQPGAEDSASGVAPDIPYEARMVAQRFPVTLYVFAGCDELCKQSRAYLKKRKVPYTEHVLQTQAEYEAFKNAHGIEGLPVLMVGDNVLNGFHAGVWDNELDAVGYPKAR